MKYITYTNENGIPSFVIFDKHTEHKSLSKRLRYTRILGAGFVVIDRFGITCYGESLSMNVQSKEEEDSKIIRRSL